MCYFMRDSRVLMLTSSSSSSVVLGPPLLIPQPSSVTTVVFAHRDPTATMGNSFGAKTTGGVMLTKKLSFAG
jgi:hypothetical protein